MKIKGLPVNVLALFFGISILGFSINSFANNAANSPEKGQFENQDGDELKRIQANQVTGTIDLNDVKAAQMQAANFETNKKSTDGMSWKHVGPNNMAGPITSIVSEDLSGKVIYVGSKHGGVFKSTNGGDKWGPVNVEGDVNLFVTSLVFSDSKKLYAGTGGDFPAQGIWVSENGAPFKILEGTTEWGTINKIAVHTKGGQDHIYVATDKGLRYWNGSGWSLCTGYNEVNILMNANFSEWNSNGRAVGWHGIVTTSGNDIIARSNIYHSDPYSCQLTNVESTPKRFSTTSFKITADHEYSIKFWVRGQGEVRVGVWNGNDRENEENYAYSGDYIKVDSDTWTFHSLNVKSLSNQQNMGQFVIFFKNTSGDHILIDDVEFFVGNMVFDTKVTDIDVSGENCVITSLINDFGSFCYVSSSLGSDKFEGAVFDPNLSNIENIAVAVAPSNPDTVYISVSRRDGKLAGAYVSGDRGQTWRKIIQASGDLDPLGGNGNSINKIFVDPLNTGGVYIVSLQVWQGVKYSETGFYDFGLKALMGDLHSNVHDVFLFESSLGSDFRNAYVVTDGGVALITISIFQKYFMSYEKNRNFESGSFSHIAPHNKQGVIGATPTLGAQAIGDSTNFATNARPYWSIETGTRLFINEGKAGPCFASWIDERFYIYTNMLSGSSEVRRSNDRGYSYQPADANAEQWLTEDMRKDNKYNRPMLMWETFNVKYTVDTVEFEAVYGENFIEKDRIVFPRSKTLEYPMRYELEEGDDIKNGETRRYPDVVQNRLFYGQERTIWMTKEAVDLKNMGNLISWYKIAYLNQGDSASCFAVSDDGNHLFIGSVKGNIYRVSNILYANDSATAIIDSASCKLDTLFLHNFDNRYVTSIAVNPTNSNNVIVTLGNYGNNDYVYESNNALENSVSFTSIQNNLPKAPAYASLISKISKGGEQYKIIGTEFGLYYKTEGEGWMQAPELKHVPVMTLAQVTTDRPAVNEVRTYNGRDMKIVDYPDNHTNYLGIFAGTYGAGVFYYNGFVPVGGIDPFERGDQREMIMVYPNPVTSNTMLDINLKEGSSAVVQIFDINGRCIQEFVTSSNRNDLDFSNKAAGIYLIRVTQGNVTKSAKVVKY
ncbi:MAG: T9SS type A sorting domain-containing protein [Bacteroidales bacterium]|jgi:hypothetical protein|nr:T9SS type A sorting domain-containing protein [Bacteroidales bacterium]